jgi:hypothetical protein
MPPARRKHAASTLRSMLQRTQLSIRECGDNRAWRPICLNLNRFSMANGQFTK